MKRLIFMLMAAGLVAAGQAALVDDFESYSLGNVRDVASPPWTAIDGTGQADIFDDGTGNQYLGFGWSGGWRGTYNDTIAPIADGTVGSVLFFNVYANAEGLDHSFGLSDVAGVDIDWYDDFEIQIYMKRNAAGDDGKVILGARNGSEVEVDTGTWYNVWAIVDQLNDTYDVYYSTGAADLETAILHSDDAAFRNGTSDSLTALVGCGYYTDENSQQEMWIDNIDLTVVPEPATLILLGLGGAALLRRQR